MKVQAFLNSEKNDPSSEFYRKNLRNLSIEKLNICTLKFFRRRARADIWKKEHYLSTNPHNPISVKGSGHGTLQVWYFFSLKKILQWMYNFSGPFFFKTQPTTNQLKNLKPTLNDYRNLKSHNVFSYSSCKWKLDRKNWWVIRLSLVYLRSYKWTLSYWVKSFWEKQRNKR